MSKQVWVILRITYDARGGYSPLWSIKARPKTADFFSQFLERAGKKSGCCGGGRIELPTLSLTKGVLYH